MSDTNETYKKALVATQELFAKMNDRVLATSDGFDPPTAVEILEIVKGVTNEEVELTLTIEPTIRQMFQMNKLDETEFNKHLEEIRKKEQKEKQKELLEIEKSFREAKAEFEKSEWPIEKINELHKKMNALAIGKQQVSRFATYGQFLKKMSEYDPDKDFKPNLFCGLQCPNGTLSVVCSRPAGGKTSSLVNIMREATKPHISDYLKYFMSLTPWQKMPPGFEPLPEFAKTQKRKILYVNLEMNYYQIIRNLHLSLMYDSANYSDRKELPNEDVLKQFSWVANPHRDSSKANEVFQKAYKQKSEYVEWLLGKKIIQIYNGISATNQDIIDAINTHTSEGDIVLIDYIQRMPAMKGDERQPRQVQLQKVSAGLLKSAIENQIVIIAGAQFNRQEKEAKAEMINIRECGDIEQDAFNIVAIVNKDAGNIYNKVLKAREGGEMYQNGHVEFKKEYIHWEVTRKEDDDIVNGASKGKVDKSKTDEQEKGVYRLSDTI
ncbi:MAG: hypothetical protein LE169_05970 [Endomicrobium sp.]|nr:hypothetical protein [Endomicrobium sp.]